MVMGASVLGATLAAIVMINVLAPANNEREAARRDAPAAAHNAPANEPAEGSPPPANREANRPPTQPPKEPPPVRREPPIEVPPPPPEVEHTQAPATHCVRKIGPLAAFRVKAKGGVWREGKADTTFTPGDRVRVSSGPIEFDFFGARVMGTAGTDLVLEDQLGVAACTLLDGGLCFKAPDAEFFFRLTLPQQSVVTRGAMFFARADAAISDLELVEGEARVFVDVPEPDRGPVAFYVGTQPKRRELAATRCAEIEELFLPERQTLLRWNFDDGPGSCALGKPTTRGYRNTGGLESAPDFAAIGAGSEVRFVPAANSRLRLRVRTNARQLRISFVCGSGAPAAVWSCTVAEHQADVWTLYEIELKAFRAEGREATFAGQACHSLQFRMRFEERDPRLPSERYLIVDDVELFTPK